MHLGSSGVMDNVGSGGYRGAGTTADWRQPLSRPRHSPSAFYSASQSRIPTPNWAHTHARTHGTRRRFRKPSVMSPTPPTVLGPLTPAGLLHHLLANQSDTCPTLLVICSNRDVFLQQLATSLQQGHSEQDTASTERLIAPTLQNLLTTRHFQLVFCTSVQALLAYLTAYGRPGAAGLIGDTQGKKKIVLVNPLTLHASTPSFSAQGLSRCFATVAETALRTGVQLHIVECTGKPRLNEETDEADIDMEIRHQEIPTGLEVEDPWEQEVSILNVSARRFGSGQGERAWAGRTVKARRIAARWFHFRTLGNPQTHTGHG